MPLATSAETVTMLRSRRGSSSFFDHTSPKRMSSFFSASGVTAGIAKTLADAAGADLYEIRPAAPYTNADLNWSDKNSRSSREAADPKSRPALADTDANIAAYDMIFIGVPIWWYVAPHIVNSFLESYDFSGKTIVVFATSGGSGFGNTMAELKPSCADNVKWVRGDILSRRQTKEQLVEWVNSLKF